MSKFMAVAIAAVVAVLLGATGATAGSLITSAKIKDGTIQTRDLSASAKRSLKSSGPMGPMGPPRALLVLLVRRADSIRPRSPMLRVRALRLLRA